MAIIPTSGEFTKVPEGGGGGGVTVVTFENSPDSPDVYTTNMTLQEMDDARPNGLIGIRLIYSFPRGARYVQMYPDVGRVFYRVASGPDGISVERLTYNIDTEKWQFSKEDYPLTPST
jgi:hypothetical protein